MSTVEGNDNAVTILALNLYKNWSTILYFCVMSKKIKPILSIHIKNIYKTKNLRNLGCDHSK